MMEQITAFAFSIVLLLVFVYIAMRMYRAMKIEYVFFSEFVRLGIIKKATRSSEDHPSIFKKEITNKIIEKANKDVTIKEKIMNKITTEL
jgi:hypothetical protein